MVVGAKAQRYSFRREEGEAVAAARRSARINGWAAERLTIRLFRCRLVLSLKLADLVRPTNVCDAKVVHRSLYRPFNRAPCWRVYGSNDKRCSSRPVIPLL